MWSELPPCDYKLKGEGGHCLEFVNAIFPNGSQYGYLMKRVKYETVSQIAGRKCAEDSALNKFKDAYFVNGVSLQVKKLLQDTENVLEDIKLGNDIYEYAAKNNLETLQNKLDPKKVNSKNNYGETLLNVAAQNNALAVVKFLVNECRAKVNYKDDSNYTPLHWAASRGHLDVVKFLIEKGADIYEPGANTFTPIQQAVYNCQLNVMKFFETKNVNYDVISKKEFTSYRVVSGTPPFPAQEVWNHIIEVLGQEPNSDSDLVAF